MTKTATVERAGGPMRFVPAGWLRGRSCPPGRRPCGGRRSGGRRRDRTSPITAGWTHHAVPAVPDSLGAVPGNRELALLLAVPVIVQAPALALLWALLP